jgi:hypothetical protein
MATFNSVLVSTRRSLSKRAHFFILVMSVFMMAAFATSQASTEKSSPALSLATTAAWETFLPTPKPVGEGQFRRWGFLIYDATLWSSNGKYEVGQPFALKLSYARGVTRDQIVDASIDQMRDLGIDVTQHPDWPEKLRQVFVDVAKGDTLTGIDMPGKGAVFFYNNQLTGQVDEALARAFFSIWLDPKTTAPDLRLSLLGLAQ